MKLLILSDGFPSVGKPFFIFVQQLVFQLADLGYEISVIAPQSLTKAIVRREGILPRHTKELSPKGNAFDVYRPYAISFGNGRKWLYKIFKGFNSFGINKILKQVRPDILYGHFWHSAYKLKGYALENSLPLFVACGEGDDALERLVETLPKEGFDALVKAVKGVISVSTENKRKCLAFGLAKEKNIIVLPNCVDDTQFHPMESATADIRQSLGVLDEDFLILFVGGFIHRKGPDRLLAAVDKLNDAHIKLAFVGKPMGGDAVIPEGDNIVFKGILEHEQLPLYLNAADLFVLPTLKEGCCNAIVEALSCGVPVVSANRPFNDDILNEHNSITINPESVDEIADAIYHLKNDKELYACKKQYVLSHSGEHSIATRASKISEFIKERVWIK